jgi:hypothetical protein
MNVYFQEIAVSKKVESGGGVGANLMAYMEGREK